MTVLQLPARGVWLADARDEDRALRLSSHPEAGCVVLSTWRDGSCVASVRLDPEEAARLVGTLAQALADQVPAGQVHEDQVPQAGPAAAAPKAQPPAGSDRRAAGRAARAGGDPRSGGRRPGNPGGTP